jgi:protein-disulfide isomerase
MIIRLTALSLMAALATSTAMAQEMTPEEVKRLALEAILENPEIIMEAVELLREQEETAKAEATGAAISEMHAALYEDANAPVLGNPDGDVTVVEFFDYNCPYCKQANGEVEALLEADPNVRLVFREWPILGDGSVYATRAALASREQGKYDDFHQALMMEPARKDEAVVLRVARSVGLDVDKLQADMESDAVSDHIAQSLELARALGFSGTPSFVIGDEGVFGLVPAEDLIAFVAEKRAGADFVAPEGDTSEASGN